MAANDGVRPWEPEIRADVRRAGGGGGGGGRSRWLRGEGESNSKWINNDQGETDGVVKNNIANPTNCGQFNVEDQKRNDLVFKNPQLLSPHNVFSTNKELSMQLMRCQKTIF